MNTKQTPIWYSKYKEMIESSVEKFLDWYLALPMSKPLEKYKQIIRYSLLWWKKLRAILALEFYLQLSWKNIQQVRYDDDIMKLCIAIEAVHAYSLVHDDLPCMDNDELRRWEPTVWKKYWEHSAVLAWDLLNSLCFECISDIKNPEISRQISKILSHAVWFYGMVWGQVEDLYFELHQSELNSESLKKLHSKKTWKLIEASIISWVVLSWESSNIEVYWKFWKKLWLAFQIKDDLLDVEWTPEETGKSVGWEEKWFVYLIGVDKTKAILSDMIHDCKKIAKNLNSEKIDFIVEYVENRKK